MHKIIFWFSYSKTSTENVVLLLFPKIIEVSIGDLPKMCLISSLLTEPFAPIITCLKDLKKSSFCKKSNLWLINFLFKVFLEGMWFISVVKQ